MTAVHTSFCCSLFATPFEGSDTKAPPLAPRVHAASLPPPADQPGRNLNIVLGESSLIIPKATAILRAAERRLKRYEGDPTR